MSARDTMAHAQDLGVPLGETDARVALTPRRQVVEHGSEQTIETAPWHTSRSMIRRSIPSRSAR